MLKALLRRQLAAFEKTWGYDTTYMREFLDDDAWGFIRFGFVASLGHGKRAPAEAIAAAGIVGTLVGDCGPCTQLTVDMGTASGVAPEVLRGILAGDRPAMGEIAALGYDFAHAVLGRRLADADEVREEIARRWGRRAVLDIALALTTAQMYPTLKYGLGHGRSCSKVVVAGVAAPLIQPEPVAA
jgi:hypothetical protein